MVATCQRDAVGAAQAILDLELCGAAGARAVDRRQIVGLTLGIEGSGLVAGTTRLEAYRTLNDNGKSLTVSRGRRSALAGGIFFAFTAPFGIVAHLTSELAGLGWHDDADVLFSARHGYLAVVALAALAVFALILRAMPAHTRGRRVSEIIETLPFEGRGARFVALSFVLQFGFFALTQIGEGCPLCGGDVFVGILTAAAAAFIGALIVTFAKRRVLELALGLVWFGSRALCASPLHANSRREQHAVDASSTRRTPFSFRYRPPPGIAASLFA